jgi:hypothetical protein
MPTTRKPAPTKRPANRPPHEPTKVDRDTVSVMGSPVGSLRPTSRARAVSAR